MKGRLISSVNKKLIRTSIFVQKVWRRSLQKADQKSILHAKVIYSPQLGKRKEQKGQGMKKGKRDFI